MTIVAVGGTLHEILWRSADADPDAPAVSFLAGPSYTRATLRNAVSQMGSGLQSAGVLPGDRVAVLLGNRPEFLTVFIALSLIGAVSIPVNTALRGESLASTLRQLAPRGLVTDGDGACHLEAVLAGGVPPSSVWSVDADDPPAGTLSLQPGAADSVRPAMVADRDLATILLTSGTTGVSKGVMWSHTTALTFADNTRWVMGYTSDDVIYTCLPLFHINALFTAVYAGILTGAEVVVAPRFSVSGFWRDVVECGATTTNMMGAMGALLWRQATAPAEREHRLRLAMVLPLPADRAQFEHRFAVPTTEVYGSTDTGMPLGIPFGASRPGACGVATPDWECQLVDDDDRPVPRGTPGELVTRPANPFVGQLGYWGRSEETLASQRNLWFHTGDLLRQDDEDWYYFMDRKSDSLRVSGENVSSVEVEQALLSHPGVAEAAVYGIPSELGEDSVVAAVVPREGADLDPAALREHVVPHLPYFAVPRHIDVRESLPRTATEKVRKSLLREQGLRPGTWDGGPPRRLATPGR